MAQRRCDDVFKAARVKIGRDLDEERAARLGLVARSDDALNEIVKRVAPL